MQESSQTAKDLAVLYVAMVLTRAGFGIMIIIFPVYIFHASDISSAIAIALYPILEAASALPIGRICDTKGRRNVLVISLGAMSLLVFMLGLNNSFYYVSALHGIMGIAAAGVTVSSLTMITDLTKQSNRGTGMGAFDLTNVSGYAVGLLAGGRLELAFRKSLGYAFFSTSTALFIAFIFSLIVIKETVHARAERISLNPVAGLDRRGKAVLPIWLSLTFLLGIVFFLPRALSLFGLSTSQTSLLLFAGVVGLGAGSVGFGYLSDRIGRVRVMVIGILGLTGLLISIAFGVSKGVNGLFSMIYLIAPFGLATSALVPSILALVGDAAREKARGTSMGLYSVMLSGGIALGTIVAGVAHHAGGLSAVLYTGTAIFLLACIVSALLFKKLKS